MQIKAVPDLALVRMLSAFAQHLGLSEILAPTAAATFYRSYPGLENWHHFMVEECGSCPLSPDSCPFFNPSPEDITHGTPEQIRSANVTMVENRQWTTCPVRAQQDDP